jgi:hypothetical protein
MRLYRILGREGSKLILKPLVDVIDPSLENKEFVAKLQHGLDDSISDSACSSGVNKGQKPRVAPKKSGQPHRRTRSAEATRANTKGVFRLHRTRRK